MGSIESGRNTGSSKSWRRSAVAVIAAAATAVAAGT